MVVFDASVNTVKRVYPASPFRIGIFINGSFVNASFNSSNAACSRVPHTHGVPAFSSSDSGRARCAKPHTRCRQNPTRPNTCATSFGLRGGARRCTAANPLSAMVMWCRTTRNPRQLPNVRRPKKDLSGLSNMLIDAHRRSTRSTTSRYSSYSSVVSEKHRKSSKKFSKMSFISRNSADTAKLNCDGKFLRPNGQTVY